MDKELLESLVQQKLSIREIAEKTEKSSGTIKNYLKKYNFKTESKRGPKTKYITNCLFCNKETLQGKMYCSKSCKSKQHYKNNPEKYKNNGSNSKHLSENFKLLALDYCGNKCKLCGYNKNYTALAFHHIDPKGKDLSISGARFASLKQEHKDELDKCITLCHNCHAIVHENLEKPLEQRTKQAIKAAKVRRRLIDEKGGKCEHCSITGVNRIFAFHHRDPTTKLFQIDNRVCNGYHIDRLKAEVDKCLLLCHNCHSEHHNPECLL